MKPFSRRLTIFFTLLAFWFLFVYQVSWSELIIGSLGVALSVVAFEVGCDHMRCDFRITRCRLALFRHIPGQIVSGMFDLVQSIGRDVMRMRDESLLQVTTLQRAKLLELRQTQQALAVLLLTLPPNFLVVGMDEDKDTLLFHQVKRTPLPPTVRELEQWR